MVLDRSARKEEGLRREPEGPVEFEGRPVFRARERERFGWCFGAAEPPPGVEDGVVEDRDRQKLVDERARERLRDDAFRREEARDGRGVEDPEPHVLHRARVEPAERRKHEHPVQVPVPERLPLSRRGRLLLLRRIEGDLLRYHVPGRCERGSCHHLCADRRGLEQPDIARTGRGQICPHFANHSPFNVSQAAAENESGGGRASREVARVQRRGWPRE
mmetsp:Transcript_18228/g.40995  ORF Transcript_18228/g.40995 Transcript_18228/m.40995 type:complete len:218 (+) Transcript_18228:183-836(+)